MNDLPDGWAMTTLGYLVQPRGQTADPTNVTGMPFVGLDHIEEHTAKLQGTIPVSEVKSRVAVFRRGDILYGRLRPYLNKVYEAEFDGTGSTEFIVFPPSSAIEQHYLARVLRQQEFIQFASQRSIGDRPRVRFEALKEFAIALPPLTEQKRIVTKLENIFTRTIRIREALASMPRLFDQYKRYILTSAFTGRFADFDPDDAPGSAPRGFGCSPAELEAVVPSHWSIRRLDEVAEIQSGISIGRKRTPNVQLVDVPYLRVANVQRGHLNLDDVRILAASKPEVDRLNLRTGDILMIEGGDRDKLGRGWIWEGQLERCVHQNHIFRIRLFDPAYPSQYISYYTNEFAQAYFFNVGTQTTNLASISKSNLSALPVPWAPREEAFQIVSYIENTLKRIGTLEAEYRWVVKLLENLEQGIVRKALSGHLVPQDPNDQPAAMLLQPREEERRQAELIEMAPQQERQLEQQGRRRRGQPAMTRKFRSDVSVNYLSLLLDELGGEVTAGELWRQSEMDLNEFYKLLRDEVKSGHIVETRDKQRLESGNAA